MTDRCQVYIISFIQSCVSQVSITNIHMLFFPNFMCPSNVFFSIVFFYLCSCFCQPTQGFGPSTDRITKLWQVGVLGIVRNAGHGFTKDLSRGTHRIKNVFSVLFYVFWLEIPLSLTFKRNVVRRAGVLKRKEVWSYDVVWLWSLIFSLFS